MEVKVIKEDQAIVFMDGPEVCREYTEGVSHQLTNIGSQKAVITWSCAPSPE